MSGAQSSYTGVGFRRTLRGNRYGLSGEALVLYAGSEEILVSASHHHNAAVRHPGVADPRVSGWAGYLFVEFWIRRATQRRKKPWSPLQGDERAAGTDGPASAFLVNEKKTSAPAHTAATTPDASALRLESTLGV